MVLTWLAGTTVTGEGGGAVTVGLAVTFCNSQLSRFVMRVLFGKCMYVFHDFLCVEVLIELNLNTIFQNFLIFPEKKTRNKSENTSPDINREQ